MAHGVPEVRCYGPGRASRLALGPRVCRKIHELRLLYD